jgi:Tol biopolymer transport system component
MAALPRHVCRSEIEEEMTMRPANPRRLKEGQVSELVVASRDGASIEVVYQSTELIEAPNWTPDGQWMVYNGNGRLFRISPDGKVGPCRINTAPIEDLNNDHLVSPDGRYVFVSANDGHLYRVDVNGGEPLKISNDHDPERRFRYYLHGISPDGEMLAYVGLEMEAGRTVTKICLIPSSGGNDKALTDGAHPVDGPEFSSDGEWVYYNSEHCYPGQAQICRMRRDESDVQQLTFDDRVNWFPHPSPDGTLIAYLSYPPRTTGHPPDQSVVIRTMTPDGRNVRDIDRFNGGQGTINVSSWSPDSRFFAYVRYPVS